MTTVSEPFSAAKTHPRDGGPTFTLRNRIMRAAWQLTWGILGRTSPVPMHSWRRFLVRIYGGQIAATAKIYPSVSIWDPHNLEMHDHACLGHNVRCYAMDKVVLGPYALISQNAHLCCGTHDIRDPDFQLQTKPITVESNAWVAADTFVGPGVTVHAGAVLGAGGVAVRDLEAWSVYAGNPARKLGTRKIFRSHNPGGIMGDI